MNLRKHNKSRQSFFLFFDGSLSSSDEPSSPGSNEPDFNSVRSMSAQSRRMTNMLLVTSSVRMVYWVHSHSSNYWPRSALCLILVVRVSSLADWLVSSSSSSNDADHGSAVARNGPPASTWQSDSGLSAVFRVTDDHG